MGSLYITGFGAGLAALPTEMIENAAQALINYRAPAKADLAYYLDIPDDYETIFMHNASVIHNIFEQVHPFQGNIQTNQVSFSVHVAGWVLVRLLLHHPKVQGQHAVAEEKTQLMYRALKVHPDIYKIVPDKTVRPRMNIRFRIEGGDPAEEAFVERRLLHWGRLG
ncbi:hypothetical protein BKA56DRAFT_613665 [Ilyonectria sp. MPI-CAGE-AT-0026]|nr:hypothetical protein BKA56DRAFT_613665 [Ilyonectria sp. MPI-CAGE-AT-0026]